MSLDNGPTSVLIRCERPPSAPVLPRRSSEDSATLTGDSGYGSITADDCLDMSSEYSQRARQSSQRAEASLPTRAQGTQSQPPPANAGQRTFDGQIIFDPNQAQIQRYHEILAYITQPLNNCLQKRGKWTSRPKTKRVDAVRLVVMGTSRENAKPHIVFFCSPDVEKVIKDFMGKSAYIQIFQAEDQLEMAFSYRVVPSGIMLRFSLSQYSAEIPDEDSPYADIARATNCGTPIRLCNGESNEWRRATLGGVLKVVTEPGALTYYAMTAGHALDDWDDMIDGHQTAAFEKDKAEDHVGVLPALQSVDKTAPFATQRSSGAISAWDFVRPKRYGDLVTAGSNSSTPSDLHYFDWALFKLDHWKPNTVVKADAMAVEVVERYLPPSTLFQVVRSVVILSASSGAIDGTLQAGMAKIAIDPGQEVIDAYVISPNTHDICDGDSGSWVIDKVANILLGHAVASDVLGDIYVVPINDTLHDISHQLKASSVSLPSFNDWTDNPKLYGDTNAAGKDYQGRDREETAIKASAGIQNLSTHVVEAVIASAQALYRRAKLFGPEFAETAIALLGLKSVFGHLLVEIQDPGSLLNPQQQERGMYARQLASILEDSKLTLMQLETVFEEYGGHDSDKRIDSFSKAMMSLIRTKMANQETTIDIFLDTVQLHNPVESRMPAPEIDNRQLSIIKDKVDVIALRLFHQGNADDGDKGEAIWQQFCKELIREGFSADVLQLNKAILRAYIRELESNRRLASETIPSMRGLLPLKLHSLFVRPATNSEGSPSLRSQPLGLSSDPLSTSDETRDTRLHDMAFISTEGLIAIDSADTVYAATYSPPPLPNRSIPRSIRIAPDSRGKKIPPDATWTKISRRLVSPIVLERAGVRYEARPSFVAVLGVLSKAEIMEYARLSTEVRQEHGSDKLKSFHARLRGNRTLSSASATDSEDVDVWDSDLEAWDSDLQAWDPRLKDSGDSDSGQDDSELEDLQVVPEEGAAIEDNMGPRPNPHFINAGKVSPVVAAQPKPVSTSKHSYNVLFGEDVFEEYDSDSEKIDKVEFPGKRQDRAEARRRQRGRDRDRDRDIRRWRKLGLEGDRQENRVALKKSELRGTFGAVGIGAAAASLLTVLAEAAANL